LLSGGVYITKIEPRWIEIVSGQAPNRGLPASLQGFPIAQLSDLHVGPHVKVEDVHQVVEIADKLGPDLVVLTGDYVSESAQHGAACASELAALKLSTASTPSWAITTFGRTRSWWLPICARQGWTCCATSTVGSKEMWLYTNRGIGLIAPAVRFLCRPEITLLRLQVL